MIKWVDKRVGWWRLHDKPHGSQIGKALPTAPENSNPWLAIAAAIEKAAQAGNGMGSHIDDRRILYAQHQLTITTITSQTRCDLCASVVRVSQPAPISSAATRSPMHRPWLSPASLPER